MARLFIWKLFFGEKVVTLGSSVMVEDSIYYVEYLFEDYDSTKFAHGRLMLKGCDTVLGDITNKRELFLTNDCMDF